MTTLTNETTRLPCSGCQRVIDDPVVCHHCGRPLCSRCRRTWWDTAFMGSDTLPTAYHCSSCLQRYHLGLPDILQMLAVQAGLGARSANRRLRRGRQAP